MTLETNAQGDVEPVAQTDTLTVDIPQRDISRPVESAASPTTATNRPRLRQSDLPNDFVPVSQDGHYSSWSASSDKQLGNPESMSDRVFPIRSVVSVDASQTPYNLPSRTSGDSHEYFPSGSASPGASGADTTSSLLQQQPQKISEMEGRPTPRVHNLPTSSDPRPLERRRTERKASAVTDYGDRYGKGARMQLFSDGGSENSNSKADSASYTGTDKSGSVTSVGRRAALDQDSTGGLVTARFKHIVTSEGHAVITGRDGQTLQRCEDEPIHIPGAVQGFGLLIALEEKDEGELLVRVVSENSYRIIGYTPQELFRLNSFTDILSEEQQDNLLDHIDFIRDEEADPASNGPEVFTISVRSSTNKSSKKSHKLWCAMHINPSHPDLVICEFELDNDELYPLVPTPEEMPEAAEDTLNSNPTDEELAESTVISSRPLRVLRSARKRKGEAAAMEVFNIMSQVQEQLAAAPNLAIFLKILVGVVKELTGFHRVMIYQFDSNFNGRVVTELVDPRATKDLYKGLNFPASDIPKQARDLYKINKVRLLYDRDLETARLVCRSVEDLETPVDLSFSYLRAMSPVHIKYLANMAVRSSMSISINAFNELWGLIACHSYGSRGTRVSFPIRKMCRLVGDTASRNIERLSYASRLQARKLINTVPTEANPSGYIVASSDDLLKLFDADFGLVSIRGETKIMGHVERSQEPLAMLEYLRLRKISSVITSQDIQADFPDLRYHPGFQVIAGMLLVPLSVGGNDFIVFFRRGVVKEVKWAGNPYEKFVKEGTEGYLEPRKSFKTWSETVVGKCRDWTEEQVETAAVLCLVYGKFIEVWRQKEVAVQNSHLSRLLLANSAHEVRTPLNAIINYLEIALEGALDQETRDNLAKSHSASKSLIYVINDLLDLTKAEEGQDLIKDEVFDLPATIREATDSFRGDAKRKGLEYEVIEHPGIPQFVYGDQQRIRLAVANITANAMQNTSSGWIRIELWSRELLDNKATIEIVVQDSGAGMSNEKLDALFRDLEQVTSDVDGFFDSTEESKKSLTEGKEDRTLGLGLAMVARIVRNMDGQLRLKSEEGQGSRFVIQLPFIIPDDDLHLPRGEESAAMRVLDRSSSPAMQPPPQSAGEVTLVDKVSSMKSEGVIHKRTVEETTSLRSFRSGSSNKSNRSSKSEVDRLIDAISGSMTEDPEDDEKATLQRSNSKGSGHSRKSAASISNAPSVRSSNSMTLDRPGQLRRSQSHGAPEHLRSPIEGPPGAEFVTGNKTLMKAIRMPDEFAEQLPMDGAAPHTPSRVLFDIPRDEPSLPLQQNSEHLQILVAEDDPINSRIIQKRLEKSGHEVYHTINGEACASVYGEKPAHFDVILMDMQMPIVDGLTSTKMIRSYEKTRSQSCLSSRAAANGRVPIFAVSASLVERERQTYINAGFDGWILKPIDFKRLNTLLAGIVEEKTRNSCLYEPGEWERGGWFSKRKPSVFDAKTRLSEKTPAQNSSLPNKDSLQLENDSLHSSESGSITPTSKAQKAFFVNEGLGSVSTTAESSQTREEAATEVKVKVGSQVEKDTTQAAG
ncbi:Cyanobacterial phytochrome B [Hyphodiscus hymeniophilus]|uniref:Cyanobacterial phytochrome B n=1 Tax=Hyphodiscus hymeniophilus TaxID=353542 RepID=A0A9P7AZJ0_9HELO|nr:Cyanobacterial phytochrome B [Hyphodiscus hymeniophilus]